MKNGMDLISFAREPGTVILDAQKAVRESRGSWLLREPERVLIAREAGEVRAVLEEAQEILDGSDCILAGYLAYEAAGTFGLATNLPRGEGEAAQGNRADPTDPTDSALSRAFPAALPLVWLGVYRAMRRIRETDWPEAETRQEHPAEASAAEAPPALRNGAFNLTGAEYVRAVERVREYIAAGDTYQVNLACKFRFDLPDANSAEAPFALYCRLRRAHPVPYGAYLNLEDAQILSFSPELFLRREKDVLMTRPMKGTAPRGRTSEEDERIARALRASSKNRAENVMIVDLMRNDLGRVCEIGSIQVPSLFDCERYTSVYQLTSAVTGRVRSRVGLVEILEAAFPCGSITGAPKRRTMQIIAELEKEPRGVYCGAIGRFGPGRDIALNVAIRTLIHRGGKCELGVGSGITWGSKAAEEWEETKMKSRFASAAPLDFRLIETLLLRPSREYAFLREHLRRLRRSARYWEFPFPRKSILAALDEAAKNAKTVSSGGLIVRLALDRKGRVAVATRPLPSVPPSVRVMLHPERIDARDVFLYHKTDRRALYDRALAQARAAGFTEAIFLNREERLTEGCFTNLFLELDGRWVTPPVSDGLLPGIWREAFRKEKRAAERSLTVADLRRASRIVIGNSVRGALPVEAWEEESGEQ